jgi:HSP20 family protein
MHSGLRNRGAVTPFERLWDVRREMDRLFEGYETGAQNGDTLWVPPMDVVETGEEILCHVEVPGMSRNDIDIRIEGNIVTIAGEKKFERNPAGKSEGFSHFERRYGRFERSFTIPQTVESDRVKARYDNGVLTVVLPKAERSKPRRVEVEGATAARNIEPTR